jgi:hypothetical protein
VYGRPVPPPGAVYVPVREGKFKEGKFKEGRFKNKKFKGRHD